MLRQENATWWQGDREIVAEDVAYIRTFVKRFPGLSRTELTGTPVRAPRLVDAGGPAEV